MHRASLAFLCGCVFTVAALTRCSVPPAKAADDGSSVIRNGTRIRMNVLTTPDGAVVPTGVLHDTQLDIDCSFQRAGDGKMRCLPLQTAKVATDSFSNADCSGGLAYATCLESAPRYASISTDDTCPSSRRLKVYALGDRISIYYQTTGSDCYGTAAPEDSFNFVLGKEVEPSAFAEGSSGS